jgi:diguanylate cyclase (GGDEF)-like protein
MEALRHQSLHDALTGLPNRQYFTERLARAAGETSRPHGDVGIVFCDLDGFKQINDTHGHGAGDEVLRQVAARLAASMREGGVLARLSGDEFVILLPDLADDDDAHHVVGRLSAALADPLHVHGRTLHVSASIGLAIRASDTLDADSLLGEADAEMYEQKRTRLARRSSRSATVA